MASAGWVRGDGGGGDEDTGLGAKLQDSSAELQIQHKVWISEWVKLPISLITEKPI